MWITEMNEEMFIWTESGTYIPPNTTSFVQAVVWPQKDWTKGPIVVEETGKNSLFDVDASIVDAKDNNFRILLINETKILLYRLYLLIGNFVNCKLRRSMETSAIVEMDSSFGQPQDRQDNRKNCDSARHQKRAKTKDTQFETKRWAAAPHHFYYVW
uniref:Uncharacterized protein n=1 Tax=Romanomermis culicivorax TaxID=13658 RepID=A0A915HT18_ROMCU